MQHHVTENKNPSDTVSLIITRSGHVLHSELRGLATDASKTITDVMLNAVLI